MGFGLDQASLSIRNLPSIHTEKSCDGGRSLDVNFLVKDSHPFVSGKSEHIEAQLEPIIRRVTGQ